jgi:hypothetical protein
MNFFLTDEGRILSTRMHMTNKKGRIRKNKENKGRIRVE